VSRCDPFFTHRVAALAVGLGCLACAAPALADRLGASHDLDVPWWRVVGATALCAALAIAAIYAVRARSMGQGLGVGAKLWPPRLIAAAKLFAVRERRMRPIETLRLSPRMDVHLFACDDTEFTIASTPQGGFLISSRPLARTQGEVE